MPEEPQPQSTATSGAAPPATATTQPTVETKPAAGTAPDYGEWPEEEREAARQYDDTIKNFSPRQRVQVFQLARERWDQLEAESKAPPKTPAPESKPATVNDDVAALRKELADFRAARQAETKRQQDEAREHAFFSEVKAALGDEPEFAGDDAIREFVEDRVLGAFMRHARRTGNPATFNPKAATKAALAKLSEMADVKAKGKVQNMVKGKLSALSETLGEAGAGTAPSRKQAKITPEQVEAGYLGDLVND